MVILSGEGAAWGQSSQRAIQLAIDEVNEKGGIHGRQIEIIFEDTGGEVKNAVSSYEKLVNVDKVVAIIGPNFQVEMTAIAPLANKDNFPIVTPSYAPLQNRPNPKKSFNDLVRSNS